MCYESIRFGLGIGRQSKSNNLESDRGQKILIGTSLLQMCCSYPACRCWDSVLNHMKRVMWNFWKEGMNWAASWEFAEESCWICSSFLDFWKWLFVCLVHWSQIPVWQMWRCSVTSLKSSACWTRSRRFWRRGSNRRIPVRSRYSTCWQVSATTAAKITQTQIHLKQRQAAFSFPLAETRVLAKTSHTLEDLADLVPVYDVLISMIGLSDQKIFWFEMCWVTESAGQNIRAALISLNLTYQRSLCTWNPPMRNVCTLSGL